MDIKERIIYLQEEIEKLDDEIYYGSRTVTHSEKELNKLEDERQNLVTELEELGSKPFNSLTK